MNPEVLRGARLRPVGSIKVRHADGRVLLEGREGQCLAEEPAERVLIESAIDVVPGRVAEHVLFGSQDLATDEAALRAAGVEAILNVAFWTPKPATIEARREDSCASSADAPEARRAEGGRLGRPLVGGGVRESLGACLPDRATEGRCIGATGRRLARSRHTWPSIGASVSDAPVPTAASWKRRR